MNISEIYRMLLENPSSIRVYRNLRDYYKACGMNHEADGISFLLENKFGELPDLEHDNYANTR